MTAVNASQVLEEAERALRNRPHPRLPYAHKAHALRLLQRQEVAQAAERLIPH